MQLGKGWKEMVAPLERMRNEAREKPKFLPKRRWARREGLTTALGLLRLLTNPKAMDGKPLEVREAWTLYREARLAGVPLLEEPEGLEEALAELVREGFPLRL